MQGNTRIKARVGVAMGLLVGAKLLNVQVPFIFKDGVNYLNEHTGDLLALTDPASTVATTAFSLMIACESLILTHSVLFCVLQSLTLGYCIIFCVICYSSLL